MKSNIATVVTLGVVIFSCVALGVSCYIGVNSLNESSSLVAKTERIQKTLESIKSSLLAMESCQRGFINSGDPVLYHQFWQNDSRIKKDIVSLNKLVVDPSIKREIPVLQKSIIIAKNWMIKKIEIRRNQGMQKALVIVRSHNGRMEMDNFTDLIESIKSREDDLLQERNTAVKHNSEFAITNIVILTAFSVGVCIALFPLIIRTKKRAKAGDSFVGTANSSI